MCATRRLCLLLVCAGAVLGVATADDGGARALLASRSASGKPGPMTDWVVAECDQRCPNLFLASWGYQCRLGSLCCMRKNSLCTKQSLWSKSKPASWTGKDLTNTPDSAQAQACGSGKPDPLPAPKECPGGGQWMNASASQYWSYPPCCFDPTADQTECEIYSGCRWEGLFSAFSGKKTLDWVKTNNIASYFEPPNTQNRREWDRKWANKQLRIRNPYTCETMTVTIVDTCDDRDCPDPDGKGPGCCTAHANMNGGHLVDLEYYTSVRFWGKPIGVDEVRRLEFQVI